MGHQEEMASWPPPDLKEDVPLTWPALFMKSAPLVPSYVTATVSCTEMDKAVTYGSLLTHVCELALLLRKEYGVENGKPVVILMDKCPRYVQCILAILVAGGSYVPLSPKDPPSLLHRVAESVKPALAFCSPGQSLEGVPIMTLSPHLEQVNSPSSVLLEQVTKMANSVKPEDLACIVFSSGTTGNPKGIAIPHMAKASSYLWRFTVTKPKRSGGSRVACNIFFVWEALRPFLRGATLVVIPDDVIFDPPRLLAALDSNRVTEWLTTPSLFDSILQLTPLSIVKSSLKWLRVLFFNGEVLRKELAQLALEVIRSEFNPKGRVFNLYSISECHEVSIFEVTQKTLETVPDGDPIPVGYVQPYARVHLLHQETHEPVPDGEVGFLHIGGPGLAVGYIGNSVLTQERFPTIPKLGRLYNTGDLAVLKDGMVNILGRGDSMVKIRGYSVVLGAVESALKRTLSLNQCCVTSEGKEGEDKRLVAYVVFSPDAEWKIDPTTGICTEAFSALRHTLPLSNIPSCYVAVESIPVHPISGKTNVKSLPLPPPRVSSTFSFTEGVLSPLTLQHLIADELCLPLTAVGPNDDFFALGGHSLLAAKFAARIKKCEWTTEDVRVADIFLNPTPTALFRHLLKTVRPDLQIGLELEKSEEEIILPSDDLKSLKSLLDEHYSASPLPKDMPKEAKPLSEIKGGILVTGATGFVGKELAKVLRNRFPDTHIIQLIRKKPQGPLFGSEGVGAGGFSFLEGDLSLPNFGLTPEMLEKLKESIGAVIHCAALVNLMASYRTVRASNVLGTMEILKLGCQVCYLSSSDAHVDAPNGYGQSKFVAEQLVAHAKESIGLPTFVIRPPDITGSGNENDHRFLMLKALAETGGYAPSISNWRWRAVGLEDLIEAIISSTSSLPPPFVCDFGQVIQWMRDEGYFLETFPKKEGESDDEALAFLIKSLPSDSVFVALHQAGYLLPLCRAYDPYEQPDEEKLSYPRDRFRKELLRLRSEGMFPDPLPLLSHVVVVSGASSGIGAAIGRRVMMAGARVALLSRRGTVPEVAVDGFRRGKDYICLNCDVRDKKAVSNAIEACKTQLGAPSIVVNNAGVMYFTLMENRRFEEWERTVDTICTGSINLIHAALPSLLNREHSGAHLVNITSDAGRRPFPGLAVYSGAKFFVEAMSTAMREEFASHSNTKHIRITNVQPGNVDTGLLRQSTDPEALKEYGEPSGSKVLEADDVARAVVYALTQPGYCAVNEILVEPRLEPI